MKYSRFTLKMVGLEAKFSEHRVCIAGSLGSIPRIHLVPKAPSSKHRTGCSLSTAGYCLSKDKALIIANISIIIINDYCNICFETFPTVVCVSLREGGCSVSSLKMRSTCKASQRIFY